MSSGLDADPKWDRKVRGQAWALAFHPDGKTLAAGCLDGTIRLVSIAP